jgi:hypothetical protein
MSITIVATPGSASANSYATEAEFIAYAAARLNVPAGTTVTGSVLTETEKAALVEAQRELTLMPWKAGRTDSSQALAWPRLYAEDPDAPSIFGTVGATDFWYDDDEIPQRVKDAQIELALEFVRAGTTDLAAADPNAGVVEKTVDVLTTRWQPYQRPVGLARFPRIVGLIAPLLATGAGQLEINRV